VVQANGLELGCLAVGFRVGRCVICDGCLEGLAVGLRVGFEVVGASVGEKDTVGVRVIEGLPLVSLLDGARGALSLRYFWFALTEQRSVPASQKCSKAWETLWVGL
jgi:hypothetical protein